MTKPRSAVVSVRLDDSSGRAVDLLVRGGLAGSRAEAAARLVGLGVGAAGDLLNEAQQAADRLEPMREDLMKAVRACDIDRVRSLIDAEPRLVRAQAAVADSAVLIAIYYGTREVAELLVEHGAELNLHEAAALGYTERVEAMLDENPSRVCAHSHDGWTPLHLAAHYGHLDVVRLLVERGAPLDVRAKNLMANMPLHYALTGRHLDVAAFLLEQGADVHVADGGGFTPLHHAAYRGLAEIVKPLLDRGADVLAKSPQGATPLDLAREQGHDTVAAILESR